MEKFFESLSSLWSQVFYAICHITFFDVIDILVIAFLVYKAIDFLRETRAGQLVKGIAVLLLLYIVANVFKLTVLRWLLSAIVSSAIVASSPASISRNLSDEIDVEWAIISCLMFNMLQQES